MSYKYGFCDNEEYGAEDVNGISKRLVTGGVADAFADGKAYNASKLNDVAKAVAGPGVVPEDVSTLRVTKESDGVVVIAPGSAFFANGSTIDITEAERLPYAQGQKNYVYLKQDLAAQNRNYPACTTNAPTDDFVLLAEVSETGEVTDKRQYAKGKLPGYQSNANVRMSVDMDISVTPTSGHTNGTEEFRIDMGVNNYSRVYCINDNGSNSGGQMGVYSMEDDSYFCVAVFSGSWDTVSRTELLVRGRNTNSDTYYGRLTFSKSGNTLIGRLFWTLNISDIGRTRHYSFTLEMC